MRNWFVNDGCCPVSRPLIIRSSWRVPVLQRYFDRTLSVSVIYWFVKQRKLQWTEDKQKPRVAFLKSSVDLHSWLFSYQHCDLLKRDPGLLEGFTWGPPGFRYQLSEVTIELSRRAGRCRQSQPWSPVRVAEVWIVYLLNHMESGNEKDLNLIRVEEMVCAPQVQNVIGVNLQMEQRCRTKCRT